jgi:hypothetical protein
MGPSSELPESLALIDLHGIGLCEKQPYIFWNFSCISMKGAIRSSGSDVGDRST